MKKLEHVYDEYHYTAFFLKLHLFQLQERLYCSCDYYLNKLGRGGGRNKPLILVVVNFCNDYTKTMRHTLQLRAVFITEK